MFRMDNLLYGRAKSSKRGKDGDEGMTLREEKLDKINKMKKLYMRQKTPSKQCSFTLFTLKRTFVICIAI